MTGTSKQTTTQSSVSEPWSKAQPALETGLKDAQNLYQSGAGSQPYTGSTVIPFSQQTMQGMGAVQNAASQNMNGKGLSGQYQGLLNSGGFNSAQQSAMSGLGGFAGGGSNVSTGRIDSLGRSAMNNPAMAGYGNVAAGGLGVDASGQRSIASQAMNNPGNAAFADMMGGGYGTSSARQSAIAGQAMNNPAMDDFQRFANGQYGSSNSAQTAIGQQALGPPMSEQNLSKIASGGMLNRQDPNFERALAAASESAANQINLGASGAGRYGSAIHQGNVAREIGNYEAGQRVGQYNNERGYQVQANQLIDQQRLAGLGLSLNAANSATGIDQANQGLRFQGAGAQANLYSNNLNQSLNAANAASGIEQGNQAMRAQGATNLANQYSSNLNQSLGALNSASGLDQANRQMQLQGIGGQGSTYANSLGQALGAAGQSAGIQSDNYARQIAALQQQFNAGQQGVNNLGTAYEGMKAPASDMMGVGSMYEDLAGRLKNDQLRIFQEQQNAPWNQLGRLNAIATGAGSMGGTSTGTAQVPGQSPFATGLGYASTGLGLLGSAQNLGWF